MKVLIVLGNDSKKKYLVSLDTSTLIEDVKSLLKHNRLDAAIMMILAGGRMEEEIIGEEASYCYTDLILMDAGSHWGLLKTI